MAKTKIIQYGNPVLEKVSELIEDPRSPETKDLINQMFKALKDHGEGAAGLSAPQIGILKKATICRRMDLETPGKKIKDSDIVWEIMINPEIINSSKELSTRWEGCLSINFGNLFGKVTRPKHVEVEYYDLEGNKKTLKASDYFAHIVQHELDHLNGVLFLKYVSDPTELYTSDELEDVQ